MMNHSARKRSTPDDMDVETDLRESGRTKRLSTESMVNIRQNLQLHLDNVIVHRPPTISSRPLAPRRSEPQRHGEQQRLEEQEFRRLQERRVPAWQQRFQHAARLENTPTSISASLPQHRYLYEETRNERQLQADSPDIVQQSPTDSVIDSHESEQLHRQKQWEQEQINAFECARTLDRLQLMEHQEQQQQPMDTDVDMESNDD